jgi:hypothetical protein
MEKVPIVSIFEYVDQEVLTKWLSILDVQSDREEDVSSSISQKSDKERCKAQIVDIRSKYERTISPIRQFIQF